MKNEKEIIKRLNVINTQIFEIDLQEHSDYLQEFFTNVKANGGAYFTTFQKQLLEYEAFIKSVSKELKAIRRRRERNLE